jgi:pilus assembly protein CpaE
MVSLNEVEGLKEKVKIVVNRVGRDSGQISLKKAQETMGKEIYWQLPNDYKTMVEVRNNGVPLIEHSPRASITQALTTLVEDLAASNKAPPKEGEEAAKAGAQQAGWLSFLGGKGKPKK